MKLSFLRNGIYNTIVEGGITDLKIDGIPYVAPAPKRPQRWEVEAVFWGDDIPRREPGVLRVEMANGVISCARAKLGFDDGGRVWFSDEDAKRLAEALRFAANYYDQKGWARWVNELRQAADRLAGPEEK